MLLEGAVFLKYGKRGNPRWKYVQADTRGKDIRLVWSDIPSDGSKPKENTEPSGYIRFVNFFDLIAQSN